MLYSASEASVVGVSPRGHQVFLEGNDYAYPFHAVARGNCPLPRRDSYSRGLARWHGITSSHKTKENSLSLKQERQFHTRWQALYILGGLLISWCGRCCRCKAHPHAAKWVVKRLCTLDYLYQQEQNKFFIKQEVGILPNTWCSFIFQNFFKN